MVDRVGVGLLGWVRLALAVENDIIQDNQAIPDPKPVCREADATLFLPRAKGPCYSFLGYC